ncbi:MAG: ligand-binding protein SH3 [SAR324 cluster bacterium]|nr:ligand-binding protein SH3 [SAR324 cluster bacterium]
MGGTEPAHAQEAPKSSPTLGQAQENLDEIISGFDDKPSPEDRGEAAQPDLESGFDDSTGEAKGGATEAGDSATKEEGPSFYSLDGFVRLDSSYNYAQDAPLPGQTDYRGLSKLRTALQLELNLDFNGNWKAFISGQFNKDFAYQLNGRETYTQEVLDTYEQESEFREVYLQGSITDDLDVKLGRQIVVWGKSDNIRVTDVLNPVDNREPGVVDIEDIRLPVTMSRFDYYFGEWDLTAIAIHEIRFNKSPVFGSDFFPSPVPLPPERVPEDGGGGTEFALALSGIFSGYDLAFYWARMFDDDAHFVSPSGDPDLMACFTPGACERQHSRITMVGAAYNIALGQWLLKAEAALFEGLEFFNRSGETFTRLDALVGFEYTPIPDSTITVEAADQLLLDFRDELANAPDSARKNLNQFAFSYRADLLRQTLQVVVFALFFGSKADEGSVRRYSATYDVMDAFSVTAGMVTYHPGNDLLDAARNNDRIILEAKYSF